MIPDEPVRGHREIRLREAVIEDAGRMEWNVLDWNEPAIRFYEAIGAEPLNEWVGYRLAGEALESFASGT